MRIQERYKKIIKGRERYLKEEEKKKNSPKYLMWFSTVTSGNGKDHEYRNKLCLLFYRLR